jgi:hypothetical protein
MAEVQMTPEERKQSWLEISVINEEQFDAMREVQAKRQARVPQPGDDAPDFEIDVMDKARKRTGDTVRLSSLRGKPVALMFGSYT